ncbi:hypothetical protein L2E82_03234 [Cichorium intybus]|uniref:Uncharacterized protein n=1 Tax=Cichorium intybus TaxID=13427 RepID=A0ACB9H445_CICIN|nr:hypothetical protein L2E82_03234 [Cichorium intybus]
MKENGAEDTKYFSEWSRVAVVWLKSTRTKLIDGGRQMSAKKEGGLCIGKKARRGLNTKFLLPRSGMVSWARSREEKSRFDSMKRTTLSGLNLLIWNQNGHIPLISPYSDGASLDLWTLEAENYRVGVLHELLSLTLEAVEAAQEFLFGGN